MPAIYRFSRGRPLPSPLLLCIGGTLVGIAMQFIIAWWCGLLGITDPLSVDIAGGIVAGSTLIYLPFVTLWLFRAVVAWIAG
jgi:hypothetical protein